MMGAGAKLALDLSSGRKLIVGWRIFFFFFFVDFVVGVGGGVKLELDQR